MLTPGQTLPLTIEKPAAGGRMIARAGGQIVLVAGAIPGERVRARISRVGKGVAFAETVDVEDASPDRREAFTDPLCGGNLLGHIAYPRQLAIKSQVIADAFARIGQLQLASPTPVVASAEEGYRMRARLHVRGARLGFFREGTHDVCDARPTRQLLPATCDALDRLMDAIRSLGADAVREIELSENASASERVVHLDASRPLDARIVDQLVNVGGLTAGPYVTDTLAVGGTAVTLRRHVLAFFQGNRHLLGDFVAHVVDLVPEQGEVIDLYAGVGLFAVSVAAARGVPVTAVEGDRMAALDLQDNAATAHLAITAVHSPVETFVGSARIPGPHDGSVDRQRARGGGRQTTVVVDPPRTGMSREALDGVIRLAARRIVYVSCDVATLARDARRFVDAGYAIGRVDGFDLFPNTPHVETVVVFEQGIESKAFNRRSGDQEVSS